MGKNYMSNLVKKEINSQENSTIKIMDRPKIFCIDIEDDDIAALESSGFNIETGTLGKKVEIPNQNRNDYHFVLPNNDLTDNLHEYDITIIDLDNDKKIQYEIKEHKKDNHTGNMQYIFMSIYPETLFNPKPFGSIVLKSALNKLGNKKHLILSFTTKSYKVTYPHGKLEEGNFSRSKDIEYDIYDFLKQTPLKENKSGHSVVICEVRKELQKLLHSYKNEMTYNQTFLASGEYDMKNRTYVKNYTPLVKSINGDIVSMVIVEDNKTIFHFPQIKNKGKFLNDFLTTVAPKLLPELFPSLTTFQWKNDKEYWLPNHEKLLQEKEQLEIEYKKRNR